VNLFNRIVVVLLFITLAAGAIAAAVLAWTIPNKTINWLADAVQWLDDHDGDTEKAILTAGAVITALVSLAVLVLELMPRRRSDVRVSNVQGGQASLSTAAVAQRLEETMRQVPNVLDAKSYVTARRRGIDVEMDLDVDPDANLAEVTSAAATAARDLLGNRMHVALLSDPKARLHYRELRLRRAAPAATSEPVDTSSNSTVVPAPGEDVTTVRSDSIREPEAGAEAWRPEASPDNTDAVAHADTDPPETDKPAKPEPETENKFE
jgi:hypothetical protein